jgi:hypothetical protein
LGYDVTGITGKHKIKHLFTSAFRHLYRFGDVNKMIRYRFTSGFATFFGLVDGI